MSFGIRITGFGAGGGPPVSPTPVVAVSSIIGASAIAPKDFPVALVSNSGLIIGLRLYIDTLPPGGVNADVELNLYSSASRLENRSVAKHIFRSAVTQVATDNWLNTEKNNDVLSPNYFLADDLIYLMESAEFGRVSNVLPPQLWLFDNPGGINPVGAGISRVLEGGSFTYTDHDLANQMYARLIVNHGTLANYKLIIEYLPI